jgi:small-conductance mechanosensitive channel
MRFRRFGDSALEYELLAWVNGPTRAARARHELNRALYHALRDAGIEIPYPRSDVTVRTGDLGADGTPADGDDARPTDDRLGRKRDGGGGPGSADVTGK